MISNLTPDTALDAGRTSAGNMTGPEAIICFSHLRWDFVYQRPQHLLGRFSTNVPVFYFEEPLRDAQSGNYLEVSPREAGVHIVVPHLSGNPGPDEEATLLADLLEEWMTEKRFVNYLCWYYTPMALTFTQGLKPMLTVYDCMDELSAFNFAPPQLLDLEKELLRRADVVFTGGQSLYEAKKDRHAAVHCFPSSIDKTHFAAARAIKSDPADMAGIPHPRVGFFGVLDERFDSALLKDIAARRPDWHFIMIGPVVKIDPESLPKSDNIHYLGGKNYKELPAYLASWDIASILFALNESTRYISPTKTPEYLAAGKPVISTAIRDVVRPYGEESLVEIALNAEEFVRAGDRILARTESETIDRQQRADYFLADKSWDNTVESMQAIIDAAIAGSVENTPVKKLVAA